MFTVVRYLAKKAKTILAAGVCVALPVVSFAQQNAAGAPAIYDENKPAITVAKDQPVFILRLAANPTTGYVWLLKDYDKTLLVPVKHQYQAPNTKLIGAPGFDLWTFRVKSEAFTVPHRTSILMAYARPWESDKSGKDVEFVVTTQAG